jgi:CRISPR-associated protein Cas2
MAFGGYNSMWTIVMFDLPTNDEQSRKEYTGFRKYLLQNGYTMMQYSVYLRHHASTENAIVHTQRVKKALPPKGEVRVIRITDKQFSLMEVYYGKNKQQIEKAPNQLQFF